MYTIRLYYIFFFWANVTGKEQKQTVQNGGRGVERESGRTAHHITHIEIGKTHILLVKKACMNNASFLFI